MRNSDITSNLSGIINQNTGLKQLFAPFEQGIEFFHSKRLHKLQRKSINSKKGCKQN